MVGFNNSKIFNIWIVQKLLLDVNTIGILFDKVNYHYYDFLERKKPSIGEIGLSRSIWGVFLSSMVFSNEGL